MCARGIQRQDLLKVAPPIHLIANIVLGHSHRMLAEHEIAAIRSA